MRLRYAAFSELRTFADGCPFNRSIASCNCSRYSVQHERHTFASPNTVCTGRRSAGRCLQKAHRTTTPKFSSIATPKKERSPAVLPRSTRQFDIHPNNTLARNLLTILTRLTRLNLAMLQSPLSFFLLFEGENHQRIANRPSPLKTILQLLRAVSSRLRSVRHDLR